MMSQLIELIVKYGTFILVAISTFLAIKIYFRNRTIELENTLFKARLDGLGSIESEMVVFFQQIDRLKLYLNSPGIMKVANIEELALDVDNQIYKCMAVVRKVSVYFSESSVKELYSLTNDFLGDMPIEENEILPYLELYEIQQKEKYFKILNKLKKETGLDKIHNSLLKRY